MNQPTRELPSQEALEQLLQQAISQPGMGDLLELARVAADCNIVNNIQASYAPQPIFIHSIGTVRLIGNQDAVLGGNRQRKSALLRSGSKYRKGFRLLT